MTQAIVSNLPISELESARKTYKFLAALEGRKIRIRYRGPRRKSLSGRTSYAGQLTCLKEDACAFSVYFE
jgi:hypothetical protein